MKVLGVMTGTSCDALDAACVKFTGKGSSLLWSASAPYPPALRKRVLEAQRPGFRFSVRSLLDLERDLGEWYGSTLARLIARHRGAAPDLIANHGQTIAHFPMPGRRGMTLQAGDPSRIARATGLTVASHFRDGDMAAGGEGAPLAPLFHRELAREIARARGMKDRAVAIHNLGGISNLTYIAPDGEMMAFDTGPANVWIDAAVERATRGRKKFDAGGALALKGEVDAQGLARALKHPFFGKAPPKSTGRDDFPFEWFLARTRARGNDLVATATAVTIESIARAYERFILERGMPLDAIYVSGGGARNRAIMGALSLRLDTIEVAPISEALPGFDENTIEARAFAWFGYLSLQGKPLGGSWTGAAAAAPPGWIVPGENYQKVLRTFW